MDYDKNMTSQVLVNPNAPKGQLFSQTYLQKGTMVDDSRIMRIRIHALYEQAVPNRMIRDFNYEIADKIKLECGVILKSRNGLEGSYYTLSVDEFQCLSTTDFLDLITLISKQIPNLTSWFVTNINIIFFETNVCYVMDDEGGVHYRHDAEFQQNNIAMLNCLTNSKFIEALSYFKHAKNAMNAVQPQSALALDQLYKACESVFKLQFSGATKLVAHEITKHLKPFLENKYANNSLTLKALGDVGKEGKNFAMLNSFSNWDSAMNNYRHAEGAETPEQPPLDFAILLFSQGVAYLRWLCSLDE